MQHMVVSLSTRVRGGLSVHSLSENWRIQVTQTVQTLTRTQKTRLRFIAPNFLGLLFEFTIHQKTFVTQVLVASLGCETCTNFSL